MIPAELHLISVNISIFLPSKAVKLTTEFITIYSIFQLSCHHLTPSINFV